MTIPDFMPVISAGSHDSPEEGACVMEYVSILAGERFSDRPACTHPVLAAAAIGVNDRLSDTDRHLLIPLIGRLFGTAPTGTDLEREVLSVRLAVWSARRVGHLVPPRGRADCAAAIDAAEAWADDPTLANAAAAAAATNTTAANAAANAAAHAAASAATNAAAEAAVYAKAAAANAVHAAVHAAASAATNADASAAVGFLAGLLDEHARLTGHTAYELTPTDKALLTAAVPTKA